MKTSELRIANDFWIKRLDGKTYDEVHLCLGYPRREDMSKTLIRRCTGIVRKTVVHEEFGSEPVEVFVIGLAAQDVE
jgi:hypothetical protein